jgi:hypothetical protein
MWWFKRPPPLMRSLPLRTDSLPLAFVLNMPNQKSRRQHVARLLEDIGFNQTRYVTPISSYASLASHTKTNIKLFSEIARLPDAWYLYLEDDVELVPEIQRGEAAQFIIDELDRLGSESHDFVYLGVCLNWHSESRGHCTSKQCSAKCGHAFALRPARAAWLARILTSVNAPYLAAEKKPWVTDGLFMRILSAPVIGFEYMAPYEPAWRGMFFQDRQADWYEPGINEGN